MPIIPKVKITVLKSTQFGLKVQYNSEGRAIHPLSGQPLPHLSTEEFDAKLAHWGEQVSTLHKHLVNYIFLQSCPRFIPLSVKDSATKPKRQILDCPPGPNSRLFRILSGQTGTDGHPLGRYYFHIHDQEIFFFPPAP